MSYPAHYLTVAGETRTVAEWSSISGTPYINIIHRIRRGWSDFDAVFAVKGFAPKPRAAHRRLRVAPRSVAGVFSVGELPRWGSVVSVTFRRAA